MSVETRTVPYKVLEQAVSTIFAAYVPEEDAHWIARCLVEADLRGVGSHGITRVLTYTKRYREGAMNPNPEMRITSPCPAVARVDGDNGIGFVVGKKAMEEAVKRAMTYGVGMVIAGRSNHFGVASSYVQLAMEHKMGSMVLTQAAKNIPLFGGTKPFLGTSPLAMGVPGDTPLLLDMSTSVVAMGKVRRASRLGQPIPADWGVDKNGKPTTDPDAVLNGGTVLPLGGPKGSGLGLMIEALCGVMSGSLFGGQVRSFSKDFSAGQDLGHFFMAFNPACFMEWNEYNERLAELVARAKSQEKAPGFEEILMPGELEARLEKSQRAKGIDIPVSELEMLRNDAEIAKVSITLP